MIECKCCGRKIVNPPCLICTVCAMTDPEGPAWLEEEKRRASGRNA